MSEDKNNEELIVLRKSIYILYECLQEAPVDFLCTGSNSNAAYKDEERWNKKWQDAWEKWALNFQPKVK